MLLMAARGGFHNYLVDWFKIWDNIQIKDLRCYILVFICFKHYKHG